MPILILMLLTALLPGCQSQGEQATQAPETVRQAPASVQIMRQGITPTLLELPSQAPQIWRQYKQEKPALVLFSEHPFLEPTPPQLKDEITRLINRGSAEEFRLHDSLERVAPILLPGQTLRAALEQNLFAEVVWYFPAQGKMADFKAEEFRRLMTAAGFLTTAEAEKLQLADEGLLEGEVRGVPLQIIHPLAALPEIGHPVVLHIDLGYFRGQFKNEISSPVYDLLQENAQLLRDSNWKTRAVTLSYSNEGGIYSLATRFLLTDLAQLLEHPDLLDGEMPENWRSRKEVLFSQNFFQESKAKELIRQNAEKFPNDPAVQYNDYQLLIQSGNNKAAFAQLDRVVALDPGYAEEYLSLAATGLANGWDEQALPLLEKALAVRPYNPFIRLQKAELLHNIKRTAKAEEIFTRLAGLPWSEVYYPETAQRLRTRTLHQTDTLGRTGIQQTKE